MDQQSPEKGERTCVVDVTDLQTLHVFDIRLIPAEWSGFTLLNSFDALEFSFSGDAAVKEMKAAIHWLYAGLPSTIEKKFHQQNMNKKSRKGPDANSVFVRTLCQAQLSTAVLQESNTSRKKDKQATGYSRK